MEVLGRGRFLRLVRKDGWEWAERVNATGVVVVVAITDAEEILFVEQHRPPVDAVVIELPAGLCGDEGDEELADAARRELLEETGFEADSMEPMVTGPSSAGMSSETLTMFLARGARKVGNGGGVGGEQITLRCIPAAEADSWLASRMAQGAMVDPKVYAALYWALRSSART